MFNWPQFLTAHSVPYVTRGPNVGVGQLAIHCPWCGEADPSEHLSISLKGAGWRCWRNPRAHAGRSRSRLIQALLRCSPEEAKRLAGEDAAPVPSDQDLVGELRGLLGVETEQGSGPRPPLTLPPEFKPLGSSSAAKPFWGYLLDRGYTQAQAEWVVGHYQLHYVLQGRYRYRVIVPIYDLDGQLMTWTARSILRDEAVRYKTLPMTPPYDDYRGPLAVQGPKALLLGAHQLLRVPNPEVLVLCEGPFDAIRVSALGQNLGVWGTCLFGLGITDAQATLLERLMVRFRRLVLLLDPDTAHVVLRIRDALQPLVVTVGVLPAGVEDPGALPQGSVSIELMQSWLNPSRKESGYARAG